MKFIYDEADLKAARIEAAAKRSGSTEGAPAPRVVLPYRVFDLSPKQTTRKINGSPKVVTQDRIYRLFTDITIREEMGRRGGVFYTPVATKPEHMTQAFVLNCFDGFSNVPEGVDVPWPLRKVPTIPPFAGYEPIALAAQGGKFKRVGDDGQLLPNSVYWVAAVITDTVERDGEIKVFESTGILQLSRKQILRLGEKFDNWREARGRNFDITGMPLRIHKVPTEDRTEVRLTVTMEDGADEWEMDSLSGVDFGEYVDAVRGELDALFDENGVTIKGFPEPDSHPGGIVMAPVSSDGGLEDARPAEGVTTPLPVDRSGEATVFLDWSDDQLREALEAEGIKVTKRMKRETMINNLEQLRS